MDDDVISCYYCGLPAGTIDHTIPQSVLNRDPKGAGLKIQKKTVSACRECNSAILGAKVFDTLALRKRYVKEKLRRKYTKYLNMPTWTEAEILALGPNLQREVRRRLSVKKIIEERLSW